MEEMKNKFKKYKDTNIETSDWVELCFKDSAEESMENFKMFWEMLTIQIEDFKKSLFINEEMLHTCLTIDLISDVQHSELCACLHQHGEKNTKIRFLSTNYLKSPNWYGKLLFIYYKYKTNFIPDFLPELSTEILKPEQRSSDQFDKDLQIIMALCERIFEDMRREGCFIRIPNIQVLTKFPEDRFAPKYLNILYKLDTFLCTNTIKKDNQINFHRISQYLKVFYKALQVNHLFRKIDAINLIKDELGSIIETSDIFGSQNLIKSRLQELIMNPEKCSQLRNPALEMLKTQITDQLKSFPDSRIIVFVCDYKHTHILKDIFLSELPSINCEVAMGNERLTKNKMQETLKYFSQEDIKVLFATTAIWEGQDIPKCNMVIRYGHVTNETSRARSSSSKYRVIVPFKMRWQIQKEITNKKRAEIMYEVINEFQKFNEDEKIKQIRNCQSERRCIPDLINDFSKLSTPSISDIWKFHCKCGHFICTSKDIRLAGTSLYLVVNQECYSSMKLPEIKSKNHCQILCASCHDKIGNRQIYQKSYFPNLTITCFALKHVGNDKIELYKKWSDIPFQISAFSAADFLNFTLKHSLSDQ